MGFDPLKKKSLLIQPDSLVVHARLSMIAWRPGGRFFRAGRMAVVGDKLAICTEKVLYFILSSCVSEGAVFHSFGTIARSL